MKRITAFFAAALLLAGLPGLAMAGGYLVVTNTGVPYAWDNSVPVPWNPDQGGLGSLNQAAAVAFTQAALDEWANVPITDLTFSNAGNLPIDVVDATDFFTYYGMIDGLSPVVFDETGSLFDDLFGPGNGVLGFATIEVITTGAPFEITESFQAYNGKWIDGINGNGEFPLANFGAVITHEFGHALNMDHNQVNGHYFIGDTDDPGFALYGAPPAGSVELMFPFLFGNALDALSPLTDDAAWAATLYPSPAFAALTSISGSVIRQDLVTPHQGANVIARNPADPFFDAVANVSGYLWNPTFTYPLGGSPAAGLQGQYDLPGLTGGVDYTVEMVQVNPNFTGGSSVGPLSPPAALAVEEFFNGANESNQDPPDVPSDYVPVAAGSSGIDLIINGQIDPNEPNDTPGNCTPLAYGGVGSGLVDPGPDQDWWCFSGNAGDLMEAEVLAFRAGTGLDPTLTLVDTDGSTIIAFNDDTFSLDSYISTCLPATGTFYLVVRSYAGSGTGAYDLSLNFLGSGDAEPNDPAINAIPLADACPTSAFGCISPAGDTDFYSFSVSAGVSLQFNMNTSDPFGSPDAYLNLYDTDGTTLLASDDDGGPGFDSQINYTFGADGTYFVEVQSSPVFDPSGVGTYNLVVGGPAFVTHSNNLDIDNNAGGSSGWSDYSPSTLGASDNFFDGHFGVLAQGLVDDGDDADFTGSCIALYAPAGDKDEKTASLFDVDSPVVMGGGATGVEIEQFTYRQEFRCDGDPANWTVVHLRFTNTLGSAQRVKWYVHEDMDIAGSFGDDEAGIDGSRNLAYQYDAGGNHIGLAVLSQGLTGIQINNFGAASAPDNTGGDGENARRDFMDGLSSGDLSAAGPGDKNVSLTTDMGMLQPGQSADLWWCVAGGTSLADLQADVDDAMNCVPIQTGLDVVPTFNPNAKGVTPVVLAGTSELDVMSLDPSTILLEGVAPKNWNFGDFITTTPGGDVCATSTGDKDGIKDIKLKYPTEQLAAALGDLSGTVVVTITGADECGRPFFATDCLELSGNVAQIVTDSEGVESDDGHVLEITQTSDTYEPIQRIGFKVPEERMIQMNVYSVTGRLIDTLVQGVTSAGAHTVSWDASGQSSGIYFIRLAAGAETITKKVMIRR